MLEWFDAKFVIKFRLTVNLSVNLSPDPRLPEPECVNIAPGDPISTHGIVLVQIETSRKKRSK